MKNRVVKKSFGLLIFLAVMAAATAVVMLLWNALLPDVLGWGTISYWQAAGLIILGRILLGGLGASHVWMHHMLCGSGLHNMDEMREFRSKMKNMNHEERRQFIRAHMAGFSEFQKSDVAGDKTE